MDDELPKSTKQWRRLIPKFSLCSILLATSLLGVFLGVWGYRTNQQTTVIKWIGQNGGRAGYDYHWHGRGAFGLPAVPRWITNIAGLDPFASVHDVDFTDSDIENIEQLSRVPHLERVWLNNSNVVDISPLSKLPRLIELNLGGTGVVDFSPIRNHNQLRWLTLPDAVPDDKLQEIKSWLPGCDIRRNSDPY